MEAAEWREWHKTSDGVEICAPSIPTLLSFLSFGSPGCFFPFAPSSRCLPTLFSSTVWTIDFAGIARRRVCDACLSNFQFLKKVSRRDLVFTMTFHHHERFFARRVSRLTFPVQMHEHETLKLSFHQAEKYFTIDSHLELIYWSQKRLTSEILNNYFFFAFSGKKLMFFSVF